MAGKNILIFYTANKKSIQFNTLFKVYIKGGHKVFLLTTTPWGPLHDDAQKLGVVKISGIDSDITTSKGKILILYSLISFCYKNSIDTVISHLQPANFIAVLAQYFIHAKVILFRHHFNFSYFTSKPFGINKNESRIDKVINSLASTIIVPSTGVFRGMTEIEKVHTAKVGIVPYIYDFKDYPAPADEEVRKIKEQYPAQLLLLMCSRMVPLKRHALVIEVVNKLVKEKHSIKLLLIDDGPERPNLEAMVSFNKLESNVIFLGFRNDVINIMAAADLLIHPSLTEASNSTVKEMGLVHRSAIVCKGVGDFDEYLDEENAFLVEIENPEREIVRILKMVYEDKDLLYKKGENLHETVIKKFTTNQEIVNKYLINI